MRPMNERELFTSDETVVQIDEQDPQQMQVCQFASLYQMRLHVVLFTKCSRCRYVIFLLFTKCSRCRYVISFSVTNAADAGMSFYSVYQMQQMQVCHFLLCHKCSRCRYVILFCVSNSAVVLHEPSIQCASGSMAAAGVSSILHAQTGIVIVTTVMMKSMHLRACPLSNAVFEHICDFKLGIKGCRRLGFRVGLGITGCCRLGFRVGLGIKGCCRMLIA